MKRLLVFVAVLSALTPLRAVTDAEVEARRIALQLAGAFANDGFKLRDGVWQGSLEPGKPQIIQVNLFAGNEYWFSLAGAEQSKKMAVSIYDETGQLIDAESYVKETTAAAGFSPGASGPYYVKVEMLEGARSAACLIYSYK